MSIHHQPRRGLWSFLWEDVTVPRVWWYAGCLLLILSALNTTLKIVLWALHQIVEAMQ